MAIYLPNLLLINSLSLISTISIININNVYFEFKTQKINCKRKLTAKSLKVTIKNSYWKKSYKMSIN